MSSEPVVIIGTGLAGYGTARELRKHDKHTPLYLISRDTGYSYSKPMLSNALARAQVPADLPNADPAAMAQTLGATIWTGSPVDDIDAQAAVLHLGAERLRYGKLVLALGASQIRVPLAGDAAGHVLSINDLDEYTAFRETIEGVSRVAIIGAGLIGSEFANDLAAGGYGVDVIEPFAHPLGRLVPEQAGTALRGALEEIGVDWHLGCTCEAVEHGTTGYVLTLSDGSTLEAGAVLSAVGLEPRKALAHSAGLDTGRGIHVDRHLRTSDPRIFALGDCMEIEGLVLPFIMPIMHAGRALGRTLAGEPTQVSYPAMPVVVKTPAHPVVVCPPADTRAGSWNVDGDADGVRAVFENAAGEALGFTLTGNKVGEKTALAKQVPAVLD